MRLLSARGFDAEYFCSASMFLEAVADGQIGGIAIIDIHMPECDGFSLIDKIRDMGIDLPAIVITGHDDQDAEDMALRHGAIGFLRKPIDEKSLLSMICSQDSKNAQ